jgi:Sugar (and other) transporter
VQNFLTNNNRNDFLCGLITQSLLSKSQWGTFAFCASFCLLSGLWVAYFVPKTEDKALEDMDKLFVCNEELTRQEEKKKDIRKKLANGYAPEPFAGPVGTPTNGFRIL